MNGTISWKCLPFVYSYSLAIVDTMIKETTLNLKSKSTGVPLHMIIHFL